MEDNTLCVTVPRCQTGPRGTGPCPGRERRSWGSKVRKPEQLTSAMSAQRLLGILPPSTPPRQGSPPHGVVGFLTAGLSGRGPRVPGWRQWGRWWKWGCLGSGWVMAKQLLKGPLLLPDGAGGLHPRCGLGSSGHSWRRALLRAGGQRLRGHRELCLGRRPRGPPRASDS